MKSLLKKLLPALALTLMITGTVAATNAGKSSVKEDGLFGIDEDNDRIKLDEPPNEQEECAGFTNVCWLEVQGNIETPHASGPYTGQ